MKRSYIILFTVAITIATVLLARTLFAQPRVVLENDTIQKQFENLIASLTVTGQTNTVQDLTTFLANMEADHNATDTGLTVAILERLRTGRTDDAIRLLETRLDGDLVMAGSLTNNARMVQFQDLLQMARRYRTKYPHKAATPEIEAGVSRAFRSLPADDTLEPQK